jgi:hypothetical protein
MYLATRVNRSLRRAKWTTHRGFAVLQGSEPTLWELSASVLLSATTNVLQSRSSYSTYAVGLLLVAVWGAELDYQVDYAYR